MNPGVETPSYVIKLARQLRQEMTEGEKILWDKLRKKRLNGFRFRRQHPVSRYILDFFCSEKKLAVEIDGPVHKAQRDYDEYRDDFMSSIGIETLRFTDDEVRKQLDYVVRKIQSKLEEK